jgi:hypothetical protein
MNGSPAGGRAHGPVFNEAWKSHERARPSEMSGKEVLPDICGNAGASVMSGQPPLCYKFVS